MLPVPNDPHFGDAFFAQVIRSVNNFRPSGLYPFPPSLHCILQRFSCYRCPRTKTRLFADTAVCISQRNPVIAARILQGHLNDITTWKNTWRMSYSGAKNSRSRHQAPHLLLNNQAIPKLQHILADVRLPSASPFPKIAPSTRRRKKPSKNPATEPTSCTGFEGASVGAIRKPCTTPTNPSSVPSSNTAPPCTPPYTLSSSTKSPPAREECSAGSFDSPTSSPPTTSTRKPTQSRSNPASRNSRAAT
jgi:hypothetical protein